MGEHRAAWESPQKHRLTMTVKILKLPVSPIAPQQGMSAPPRSGSQFLQTHFPPHFSLGSFSLIHCLLLLPWPALALIHPDSLQGTANFRNPSLATALKHSSPLPAPCPFLLFSPSLSFSSPPCSFTFALEPQFRVHQSSLSCRTFLVYDLDPHPPLLLLIVHGSFEN